MKSKPYQNVIVVASFRTEYDHETDLRNDRMLSIMEYVEKTLIGFKCYRL